MRLLWGPGSILAPAASVAAVVALALLVASGSTEAWDRALAAAVRAAPEPASLLQPITEAGSTWAVTGVAVLLLVGLALRGTWRIGAVAAGSVAFTALVNATVKRLIARERPEPLEALIAERGFSFPSGHALLSAACYGVVAVLVIRSGLPAPVRAALVGALTGLVVLIGTSRVYLGVHFPSDVLAGWLLGLAVTLVFARITRRPLEPQPSREGLSSPAPTARGAAAAGADRAAPRSGRPGAG